MRRAFGQERLIVEKLVGNIPHIYFDWNAIQYLKRDIFERKDNDDEAYVKWNKFLELKKYKMPLSEAHCKDLGKTKEDKWVEVDLNFLDNFFVDESWILEIVHPNDDLRFFGLFSSNEIQETYNLQSNLRSFYESFKNRDKFPKIDFSIFHEKVKVDLDLISNNHPMKKFILEDGGYLSGHILERFVEEWRVNNKDKDYIKDLRKFLIEFDVGEKAIYKSYENPDQWGKIIKGFMQFITIDDDSIELNKEFIFNFFNFSKIKEFDFSAKIYVLFSLLNLTISYGDKYNKKNLPSNSEADLYHIMAAWKCNKFVTDDNRLAKKINAINKILGLNIKVVTLDKLLE